MNNLSHRHFCKWEKYFLINNRIQRHDTLQSGSKEVLILSTKIVPSNLALLTRCYTQHALRPYIDSEINHIRHFIKIPFINKGINFIDLPSIFRDNTVESSIPDYFENREPPIICYKYNKPIRSTIFNFNKLVATLDIDTKTPDS